MRRLGLLTLCTVLTGCAWFSTPPPPPEQRVTPGARVIYNGGGFALWTVCDRGNLVYMTQQNPQIFVVPNGCPTGIP